MVHLRLHRPTGGDGIVPGGTTYTWGLPVVTGGITGAATGAGAANISGTLSNPTNTAQTATYTVTPLSGACTGSTFSVTITVDPTPVVNDLTTTTCGACKIIDCRSWVDCYSHSKC